MCSISACLTRTSRKQFERIPEILHGTDPSFIPPFPGSVAKFLDPGSLFNRQHGRIVGFVAHRDGRPVGRIAAIHNRAHNAHWDDKVGFFGFFDCEDDAGTARALFAEAARTLSETGCDAMRGPYNPTINEDCGLLVDGFETPPSISMPWNPAYYARLMESAGLAAVRELHAFHLPLHIGIPSRVQKIAARLHRRSPDIRIRSFDMSRLEEELRLVHRLYNATLDRNWGFVPISLDDLLASAADLRGFADPEFLIFAEVDGEPAAFMLTLPNFNEVLAGAKGVPHWLRLPWIVWLMKTRRIRTVRQAVLGVAPEHRDRGIAALLCNEMVRRTQKKADSAELSWIEANNTEVIELIGLMGATRSKTYHIYERAL